VFLAGALLKAANINLFIVQISYYGVLRAPVWLVVAALGTLAVETALGVALLLRLRLRGLTFAAVLALLAAFSVLIAYAWRFHDLKDCGCFGPIEISPGASLAKNAVLAVLAGLAWLGSREGAPADKGAVRAVQASASALFAGKASLAALAAAALVTHAFFEIESLGDLSRPYAQFVFEADGAAYDLGEGEFFVAVLNTTCEHCMASVEQINELTDIPGFPQVVGICYEEHAGALEAFVEATLPRFPLYSLGDRIRTFYALLDDVPAPPRFLLVREGRPVAAWSDVVPDAAEVLEVSGR